MSNHNNQNQPAAIDTPFIFTTPRPPKYHLENGHAILAAMNAVQNEIIEKGGIGKDRKTDSKNADYKYNYRGIDDMYNALSPILAKHQVTCMPNIEASQVASYLDQYGKITFKTFVLVRYTFFSAIDGSYIEVVMAGEAQDKGDKGISKALSMAQKYLFIQTFAIPTNTDHDPDRYTSEAVQPKNNHAQHQAQQRGQGERLASLEYKNKVDELMRPYNNRLAHVIKGMGITFPELTHAQLAQIEREFHEQVIKPAQQQNRQS